MQEKSGAWPNGQTPLCLQSEMTPHLGVSFSIALFSLN